MHEYTIFKYTDMKGKDMKILKRTGLLTVLLLALILMLAGCGEKDEIPREGLEFTSNGDGTCFVAGIGTCTDKDIIIPEMSPEGDRVTSIGGNAFKNCTEVTSIVIPEGVVSISGSSLFTSGPAFEGCSSLKSIIIPDSVMSIGGSAFTGCDSLIQIEDGVSYVDKWVIDCDESVTNVTLRPNTVGLAAMSFSDCSAMTSITLPNSLKSICGSSFKNCDSLTSLKIPDSVEKIDDLVFYSDSGDLANQPLKIVENKDGVLYVDKWVVGCDETEEDVAYVTLREDTVGIADSAFLNLKSIVVPASVRWIGDMALVANGMVSVTVDDSNPKYHDAGNCIIETATQTLIAGYDISEIPADGSVKSIGVHAFAYADVTNITIPDTITSIGKSAFSNCSYLTSIEIPDSVTTIGFGAFQRCENLTKVKLPNNITSISGDMFYWCKNLTSVVIPDSVTSIGRGAFCWSGLENIEIPDGVTSIGIQAFGDCHLRRITLPDNLTKIGIRAFEGCKLLTNVKIPDNVTTIGEYAFFGCGLICVEIPAAVTSIGGGAFGCSELTSITIDDQNSTYYDKDNCIIEGATKILIAGCSSSVIPKDGSVTSIGDRAFSNCNVTSIEIPENVTSIGDDAFSGCDSLTSIEIPENVTSIGEGAFSGCDSLTNIIIPKSIKSIGVQAFSAAEGLVFTFAGTKTEWESIEKAESWLYNRRHIKYTVHCADGILEYY